MLSGCISRHSATVYVPDWKTRSVSSSSASSKPHEVYADNERLAMAQAEVSVEQLNPGTKRIQRLLTGYESPEWRAPFGDPIVSNYPGFG